MERDWRFIVDSLLDLSMADTVEGCIKEELDLLEYLITFDQLSFNLLEQTDSKSVQVTDIKTRGKPASLVEKFIKGGYANDPYFYGWGFFKETVAFRDTDMLSDEFREQSATYRDIYEPEGVHYAMRMHLVYKQRSIASIVAFNSKEHGDFSERDLYVFNMLAPHFAFRLGSIIEEKNAASKTSKFDEACAQYGFTPREQEIVKYLLGDVPDADLANLLYISTATLKKHIYNIYKKVDVNNRLQLVKAFDGLMDVS